MADEEHDPEPTSRHRVVVRYDDIDMPDAELLELGRIAYWAAMTEAMLHDLVIALGQRENQATEDRIDLMVRGAGASELDTIARRLVEELDPADREFITEQLGLARAALKRRNDVVHGTWIHDEGRSAVVTVRKAGHSVLEFDRAEGRAIAQDLADAMEGLASALFVARGIFDAATIRTM